jgi:hypothetical protein
VTSFGGTSEGSRIKLSDGLGEQSPAPDSYDLQSTLAKSILHAFSKINFSSLVVRHRRMFNCSEKTDEQRTDK